MMALENESMMGAVARIAEAGLTLFALIFAGILGILLLLSLVFFLIDISQTKDTVRRNYPVLGRFRSFFSSLGEFFRQYFFAMDREEMPFNRAEREWINHVSKHGSENPAIWLNPALVTRIGDICQWYVS